MITKFNDNDTSLNSLKKIIKHNILNASKLNITLRYVTPTFR